jgi:hypothetical protein
LLDVFVLSALTYPPHARAYGWTSLRITARMSRADRRRLLAFALRDCRRTYQELIATAKST